MDKINDFVAFPKSEIKIFRIDLKRKKAVDTVADYRFSVEPYKFRHALDLMRFMVFAVWTRRFLHAAAIIPRIAAIVAFKK